MLTNAPMPPQISTDSNRNPFVEWTNHNIQRAMIIRALVRQVDQSVHLARNQDYLGYNLKFLAATTMQTECRVMLQAAARRMLVSATSCAVGIIPKSSIV